MDSILSALVSTSTTTLTTVDALMYGGVAAILGLIISLTYIKTGKTSKNFARTLIILPILVFPYKRKKYNEITEIIWR